MAEVVAEGARGPLLGLVGASEACQPSVWATFVEASAEEEPLELAWRVRAASEAEASLAER